MNWKAIAVLVVALAAPLISVGVGAQDTDIFVRGVEVAGQTHLVQYRDGQEAALHTIQQALERIIPKYEVLWGGSSSAAILPVYVEITEPEQGNEPGLRTLTLPVPSDGEPWAGAADPSAVPACYVPVANDLSSLADEDILRFELALDVARCYLQAHFPDAEGQDWIFEGLATWQAVQVFDPPIDTLTELRDDFADGYSSNVLNASAEALFFWEFLLDGGAAIISPTPLTLSDLAAITLSFDPPTFFAYAQAVAQERLLWQPPAEELAEEEDIAALPDEVELDLEGNSILLTTIHLPALEPNEGVEITGQSLSANGVMVGILSGGGVLDIPDGNPLRLCGDDAPATITLVAGRANSADIVAPSLSIDRVDDCQRVPACIVGTWDIHLPPLPVPITMSGQYQIAFQPDGRFTQTLAGLELSGSGVVFTVDAVYSGETVFQRDPADKLRYVVSAWNQSLQPGASATLLMGDRTEDYTGMLAEPQDTQLLLPPPVAIQCATNDATNPMLLVTQVTVYGDAVVSDYSRAR